VFNLTGGVETIQNVLEHPYEGQIYNIETMHSIDNLRITPEHPVYALVGQVKGLNYNVIENRLNKNISQFEWIDAKDLQNDDMLVYKIPSHSTDIDEITADDCYMYGIILGDGSMSNKTDSSGHVTIHTINKKHIADFMEVYFNKNCVEFTKSVDNNTTRIRWNRCIHLPFRYNDFYDETKQKRVQARWLNLPLEKSKQILNGSEMIDYIEVSCTNDSSKIVKIITNIGLK
jgi:ribonucleoside-diphosphate reductase alpha chain